MGTRLFTVTFVLAISVVSANADIGLHVSAHQAVLLAQDIRFEPALQLAGGIGVGTSLAFGGWTEIGATVAVEKLSPSPVGAGYQYRGLTARSLYGEVALLEPARPDEYERVRLGGRLRLGGSLASYDNTFLIFFYPSVEIGAVVIVPISHPANVVNLGFEWYLSAAYGFRQDLDLSLSVGLHARIRVDFPLLVK